MKQLTCEMCGSTDLMKQDGVFVCQSCGTKYSVEEARKLMIEGTVDVTGSTVKVDTSAELANLYQIARRAKDDNNGENAAKYYDMILVKDPTSWEAAFYVVYFKAMECKIAQIRSAAISVSNCLDSVLSLIKNQVSQDEQLTAVNEIVHRSSRIAHMLTNGAKSHYDGISSNIKHNYTQEYISNASAARDIMYNCGTYIDRIFGDNPKIGKVAVEAWKDGVELHKQLLPYLADKASNEAMMISYAKKAGKYNPAYTLETEIDTLKKKISSTPTEPKWRSLGIFFIVAGAIMFCMGLVMISLDSDGVWACAVGVVEIALGILTGKPNMKMIEKNRQTVAEAKAELAKLEAELKELKK